MTRTCHKTGLALVPGPVSGVRIANPAYGPTPPHERTGADHSAWSRWDTPGRTLYIASTRQTAFRECLAWARMTGQHLAHVEKLASLFDQTPAQVMRDIGEDWERLGHMQPGHLPAAWRDGHLVYQLIVPDTAGWWVDVHAQQSLDALSLALGSDLAPLTGQHAIDKGVAFSNNRAVTTRLATWMRDQVLDDGTAPLGVRFSSRVADGLCWAMWMRRADAGRDDDPVHAQPGAEITPTDPIFQQVTDAYGIRSW